MTRVLLLIVSVLLCAAQANAQPYREDPAAMDHLTTCSQPSVFPVSQFCAGIYNVNEWTGPGFPDYWRGALFVYNLTHDQWDTTPGQEKAKASNGITVASMGSSLTQSAHIEGIVIAAGTELGGDGTVIGLEVTIDHGGTVNDTHADGGWYNAPSKTNIWLANHGTRSASWMIDSAIGTPWLNGISLRSIVPGGRALAIPDRTYITVGDSQPMAYVEGGLLFLYSGSRYIEIGNLMDRLAALEARRR